MSCFGQTSKVVPPLKTLGARIATDTWPGLVVSILADTVPYDLTGSVVTLKLIKGFQTKVTLSSTGEDEIVVEANVITVLPRILNLPPGDYRGNLIVDLGETVTTFFRFDLRLLDA